MSKKNNVLTLKSCLYALAVVLSIVAICMMFVNAFRVSQSLAGQTVAKDYTGVQATFGEEDVLGFSFMNLLSYLLVLIAAILCVLKFCGLFKSKIMDYVIVALFIVAAIFFFLTVQLVVWSDVMSKSIEAAKALKWEFSYPLGAGPIVSGVLSLVSAGIVAGVSVIKEKGKKK